MGEKVHCSFSKMLRVHQIWKKKCTSLERQLIFKINVQIRPHCRELVDACFIHRCFRRRGDCCISHHVAVKMHINLFMWHVLDLKIGPWDFITRNKKKPHRVRYLRETAILLHVGFWFVGTNPIIAKTAFLYFEIMVLVGTCM